MIYRNKRTSLDKKLIRIQHADNCRSKFFWRNVLGPDLQYTRRTQPGVSENNSEIQVVGEHNRFMLASPFHNLPVRSFGVTFG